MKYNKTYNAYRRHIADETVKLISNYLNFYLHGSQLQFKFFRVLLKLGYLARRKHSCLICCNGFFFGGQIVNSNY